MNPSPSSASDAWRQHVRIALSAGAVLAAVHLARAKDYFSDFTRPTVTFALRLFGIDAVDHGTNIAVGTLEVPWTRDCAGLNLLLVLVALTIWVNRSSPVNLRYWSKIALTVPAALTANVLRVLTLIAYRQLLYPHVESPQLHYFMGLVWLLPFVALMVPKGSKPLSHSMVEAMQAASVVALLAPMSGVPGGDGITIAAILGLAHCQVQTDHRTLRNWLMTAWVCAAVGITLVGLESFWMPWLLLCPVLVDKHWILSPTGLLLTAGTHPLFGMIPGSEYMIWGAAAYACWKWIQGSEAADESASLPASAISARWQMQPLASCALFILPFVASTLVIAEKDALTPPSSVTFTDVTSDTYKVSLPNQPENIGLMWFNPVGNGRHHSIQVCMRYRGVELQPTPECTDVYTDGDRLMREFYIQDGKLVTTYPEYILQTFRPRSSPGVHLIFATYRSEMDPETFNRHCMDLAVQLQVLCTPDQSETTKVAVAH